MKIESTSFNIREAFTALQRVFFPQAAPAFADISNIPAIRPVFRQEIQFMSGNGVREEGPQEIINRLEPFLRVKDEEKRIGETGLKSYIGQLIQMAEAYRDLTKLAEEKEYLDRAEAFDPDNIKIINMQKELHRRWLDHCIQENSESADGVRELLKHYEQRAKELYIMNGGKIEAQTVNVPQKKVKANGKSAPQMTISSSRAKNPRMHWDSPMPAEKAILNGDIAGAIRLFQGMGYEALSGKNVMGRAFNRCSCSEQVRDLIYGNGFSLEEMQEILKSSHELVVEMKGDKVLSYFFDRGILFKIVLDTKEGFKRIRELVALEEA